MIARIVICAFSVLLLSGGFARHAAAREGTGVGVCRKVTCPCTQEQLEGGMADTDKGCSKCNQAALDKAKEEFAKWIKIHDEQFDGAAMAEEAANEPTDQALEAGDEYFKEMMTKVPLDLVGNWTLEKIIDRYYSEHIAHELGIALELKDLGKIVIDTTNLLAKQGTAYSQASKNAAQAAKADDLAYESLEKAKEAKKKLDELEKQCKADKSKGKPDASPNADDGWKSSGQRDDEAARKILESWTKVEGGYEDANGNFHDSNEAANEALAIVQGAQTSFSPRDQLRFVRTGAAATSQIAASPNAKLNPTQLRKFEQAFARSLQNTARGLLQLKAVKKELQKIHALRKKP